MWMPRTSSLQEDLASVAAWLFNDHYEQCGIKPPCDTFCVSVDWEGSVVSMMLAHDPWHKMLTIKPLLSRLRHGGELIDSLPNCRLAQFVVVGMKHFALQRFFVGYHGPLWSVFYGFEHLPTGLLALELSSEWTC